MKTSAWLKRQLQRSGRAASLVPGPGLAQEEVAAVLVAGQPPLLMS